jgi:hypothetical protein
MNLHAPKARPKRRPAARRRLSTVQKAGIGSAVTVVGLLAIGVVAGILIDRLIDMSDIMDAGGEWDEGGGVHTRWY